MYLTLENLSDACNYYLTLTNVRKNMLHVLQTSDCILYLVVSRDQTFADLLYKPSEGRSRGIKENGCHPYDAYTLHRGTCERRIAPK